MIMLLQNAYTSTKAFESTHITEWCVKLTQWRYFLFTIYLARFVFGAWIFREEEVDCVIEDYIFQAPLVGIVA